MSVSRRVRRRWAGMDRYTLRFASQARLNETLNTLDDVELTDGSYLARDPAGNTIALQASDKHSRNR